MSIRATIPVLLLLALGCAPSVAPISPEALAKEEVRYRLVLDQSTVQGPPSAAAVARMGLAIERALAARGILRAAEWESATLTIHFAIMDGTENLGNVPRTQYRYDQREWDRTSDGGCNADRCSMAYWTPLIPVSAPQTATAGSILIRVVSSETDNEIWSARHLEHTDWSRVGQRRADEIAREMTRSLATTNES